MEYMSREDYCEENCGKENREGYKTCKNCGMLNVPSADVQSVDFVQNVVLNYLFNKEREAESMPYSDVRQERITTLREVIRYVEGIGDING